MRRFEFLLALLLVCLCAGGATPASADIVADNADDVCAPSADPCNVTQRVELVGGSVLNFGLRTLVVSGAGKFDFLDGSATVLAGPVVLGGNGVGAVSGGSGGAVNVKARRGCSASPARPCLAARDCTLGACLVSSTCAGDAAVACATNADCELGTCSLGAGTLTVGATVSGNAASPAFVTFAAAGDLLVNAAIDVSGTGVASDGGSVALQSHAGSLTVAATIKAGGGGEAFGGTIDLTAGTDIVSSAILDVTGGDGDGGSVSAVAGRDLTVSADINVSAVSGAGYGGDIDLSAGRDLSINGASFDTHTSLVSVGHKNGEVPAAAGDGGDLTLDAGRNLTVQRYVDLTSRGAIPEGYGGDIDIAAGGVLSLAGEARSNADGNDGDGGSLTLTAGGSMVTTDTATLEVDGGNGGYVVATSQGPVALGGTFLLGARINGGIAGSLSVTSGADADVTATVTALKQSGTVDFEACRLVFVATAKINNNTLSGANTLVSRESMKLLAGSSVTTKTSGRNTLVYRSPTKPPLRQGTISPAPELQLDETLNGCPVCGNGEVDQSETCDDGNTAGGDGCSNDCQLESCIAQTTGGYPANPLCFDGSDCTIDTCNTQSGNCVHVVACSDGVACTADSCQGTSCVHTPNPAACSDGTFCNGTEVCDPQTGCGAGPIPDCDDAVGCTVDSCSNAQAACLHAPDAAACDDGVFCNGEELCSTVAGCVAGAARDCSDALACSIDTCNEDAAACQHAGDDAACEDGDECTTNSCSLTEGCVKEFSGLPGCVTTTTTTLPAVMCGDATGDGAIKASDALLTLRSAVGSSTCDPTACDVNDSGVVTASDALAILKAAVGQTVELHCPSAAAFPESAAQ
ncbi:MAG: hypothetical protein HY899_15760 [Deltaproteobacteria bacterium]|nr:hypothetical protein [Deltaproteobacteria bacterium]